MRKSARGAFILAGAVMIWLGISAGGITGVLLVGFGTVLIYFSSRKK